jgi:hypothetical protein
MSNFDTYNIVNIEKTKISADETKITKALSPLVLEKTKNF